MMENYLASVPFYPLLALLSHQVSRSFSEDSFIRSSGIPISSIASKPRFAGLLLSTTEQRSFTNLACNQAAGQEPSAFACDYSRIWPKRSGMLWDDYGWLNFKNHFIQYKMDFSGKKLTQFSIQNWDPNVKHISGIPRSTTLIRSIFCDVFAASKLPLHHLVMQSSAFRNAGLTKCLCRFNHNIIES